mmetsp:Transcript_42810/g.103545  ORF Transcript_42810/g.103545 Transcript_42810/m.103545 type:complete len:80 (-) Transcript_42810:28-267(-)
MIVGREMFWEDDGIRSWAISTEIKSRRAPRMALEDCSPNEGGGCCQTTVICVFVVFDCGKRNESLWIAEVQTHPLDASF